MAGSHGKEFCGSPLAPDHTLRTSDVDGLNDPASCKISRIYFQISNTNLIYRVQFYNLTHFQYMKILYANLIDESAFIY